MRVSSSRCIFWTSLDTHRLILMKRSVHSATWRYVTCSLRRQWSKGMLVVCYLRRGVHVVIGRWVSNRAAVVGCCRLRKEVVLIGGWLDLLLVRTLRNWWVGLLLLDLLNAGVGDSRDTSGWATGNLNLDVGHALSGRCLSFFGNLGYCCFRSIRVEVLRCLVHHFGPTIFRWNSFRQVNCLRWCSSCRPSPSLSHCMVVLLTVSFHAFY